MPMQGKTLILAIIIISVVTAALRFIPFLVFGGNRKTPKFINYLGKVLPYAIMGMLVVYCLKDMSFVDPETNGIYLAGFLPAIIAGAAVVGSYVWKRNTLISIVGGTVLYMILLRVF